MSLTLCLLLSLPISAQPPAAPDATQMPFWLQDTRETDAEAGEGRHQRPRDNPHPEGERSDRHRPAGEHPGDERERGDRPGPDGEHDPRHERNRADDGNWHQRMMRHWLRRLELDETQEPQFNATLEALQADSLAWYEEHTELLRAHREAVEAWHDQNRQTMRELRQRMRDAEQNDDQEAKEEAIADMRELLNSMPRSSEELSAALETLPNPEDYFMPLRETLNEEQQITFDEIMEHVMRTHDGIFRLMGVERPARSRPANTDHTDDAPAEQN